MIIERRSCLRHRVNGPVFASFDGVTGGMILDLSEQGLAMQTSVPLEAERRVQVRVGLQETDSYLETTGYIAWADALGRAGVRFSELPMEARQRLDEWLAVNDEAPSRKAPTLSFERGVGARPGKARGDESAARFVSLEAPAGASEIRGQGPGSSTVQYEFNSLGSDLNSGLRVISERAQSLLRGTGAAIAIKERGPMMCRASVGSGGPPLGTRVDVYSGFSGECVRTGKALRCDDAEIDARVERSTCKRLGIRSIVAVPMRYEREIVGLVAVFSPNPFAFDEGDVAVLDRLAQTALIMVRQSQMFKHR
jgi:GAF domain-containing protein